jgi:hypothetical protein
MSGKIRAVGLKMAALPGSLARQPCPAALPGSLTEIENRLWELPRPTFKAPALLAPPSLA